MREQIVVPTINEIRYQAQDRKPRSYFDSRRVPRFKLRQKVQFLTDSQVKRIGRITKIDDIGGFFEYCILSNGTWFRNIDQTQIDPIY
jgi:hypothetical protein